MTNTGTGTTREQTQRDINLVHSETENQQSDTEGCADPAKTK